MSLFRTALVEVLLLSVCASSLAFQMSAPLGARGAVQRNNPLLGCRRGGLAFSRKSERKTTLSMQSPPNRNPPKRNRDYDWEAGMAHGIKPRVVGDGIGGERDPVSFENLAAALRFTLFNFSTIGWVIVGSSTVYICSQVSVVLPAC
eukprot:1732906-Rhodomonas_salina.1